jgi:putative two-component system response regulator
MRTHTTRGVEICRHLQSLQPVLPLIRSHHERWDGSGYPEGLVGERIPLLARVLQIADIYDALTSPRPYKPAYTSEEALRILEDETKRGWRDPRIVKLFFRLHEEVLIKLQSTDGDLTAMRNSLAQLG